MNSEGRWQIRPAAPADWPAIRDLLVASELPPDGAEEHLAHFIVAEEAGEIVGCAGLEIHGQSALLRSCAVDERYRQQGLGQALVQQTIARAASRRIREMVLLTTTAEAYFPRFGFHRITREQVAEALKASQEFRGACPASAWVMRLQLAS